MSVEVHQIDAFLKLPPVAFQQNRFRWLVSFPGGGALSLMFLGDVEY